MRTSLAAATIMLLALPVMLGCALGMYLLERGGTPFTRELHVPARTADGALTATALSPAMPVIPASPSGLLASAVQYFAVELVWVDQSFDEIGFEIARSGEGEYGPFTPLAVIPAGVTAYTDHTVLPESEYCYVVRAVSAAGPSGFTPVACALTASEGDYSLQLDGIDDHILLEVAGELTGGQFTLEAWFRQAGSGAAAGGPDIPLVSLGAGSGPLLGIRAQENVLSGTFQIRTGCGDPIVGTTPIARDTWYHAALTHDGRTLSLYLNGNLEAAVERSCLEQPGGTRHATLGAWLGPAGAAQGAFHGVLDEVRIWNTARSQAQVREQINTELYTGPGLAARCGLNEGPGSLAIHCLPGGTSGRLVNGPVWRDGSAPFDMAIDADFPAVPVHLNSIPQPGVVQLAWSPNIEPDLAGYRLYRSTSTPVLRGQPLAGLLAASSYVDTTATPGITYYYAVAAVDRANNESGLSNETSAVALAPIPLDALDLGSSYAYVALGDQADLAEFTLETWLRREGQGTAVSTGSEVLIPVITNGTAGEEGPAGDINYFLGIRATDGVLCADFEESQTSYSPGRNHPVCGVTSIQTGTWYHAAVTYDGAAWRLYLNGDLERSLNVGQSPNTDNTSQLALGTLMTQNQGPAGSFDGTLDEVRIWDHARTHEQIAGAINLKLSAPQAGLAGRWGLDEGTGSSVRGLSGSVIAGSVAGSGYSWVPGAPFNATANLPPALPILVTPLSGGSSSGATAALSVTVSDPNGGPLEVIFHGRPLRAPPGPDFTVVAIPDPQFYASTYPAIYNAQMQWILDNRAAHNIVYVASLGDNVDSAASPQQWMNSLTAWNMLDAGGVPYGLAAGNHDGAPSNTASFNTYFGEARFAGKPYYGGHYGADNDNHYALFSAGGLDFIVIFIEFDPRMTSPGHPVLRWANDLLQAYRTRRGILVSHYMMEGEASTQFSTQGAAIYQALRGNPNLFLMLAGHLDVAAHRVDTYNGSTVYTLRSDYQNQDGMQSGYLRLLRFSPSAGMIHVRTYSPTQNKEYDKPDAAWNNFSLPYDMSASGFTVIGTATAVPSGATTTVHWMGLLPGSPYEWFVTVSDGTHRVTGGPWTFSAR